MRWAVRQGIHYRSVEGVIPRTIARMIEEGPSPTGDMDRDVRQRVAIPEQPVPTATGLAFMDHGHHEPRHAGGRLNGLIAGLGGWCGETDSNRAYFGLSAWGRELDKPEMASFRQRRWVFHGLQKNAVNIQLEVGCSEEQVAAILATCSGWGFAAVSAGIPVM